MSILCWLLCLNAHCVSEMPVCGHTLQFHARQEIVWTGKWEETTHRKDLKTHRAFDWETRLLILDRYTNGSVAAMLTTMKRPSSSQGSEMDRAIHTNLDLLWIDAHGSVSKLSLVKWLDGKQLEPQLIPAIPVEGLPTIDATMFLELPCEKLEEGLLWDVFEPGRAFRTWKIEKIEFLRGAKSLQILGKQQSPEWHLGYQSKRTTWDRTDKLWISEHGYASKIERHIQLRDPESLSINVRSHLVLEQKQTIKLTRESHCDRQEEIKQIMSDWVQLQVLLPESGREAKGFDLLLKRMNGYMNRFPAREELPYRQAMREIHRQATLAKQGKLPPSSLLDEKLDVPSIGLARDHLAPDFLGRILGTTQSIRLHRCFGKVILLVYFQPSSDTSPDLLRFAESLQSKYPEKLQVFGVVVGNETLALEQRQQLRLTIPMISDREVRRVHTLESTPELVILDAQGIVRKMAIGWGKETPGLIRKEIEHRLKIDP